jgi:KDO2-lipid IV(A) lauroyltransferase
MAKKRSRAADFGVYLVIRAVVCVVQAVPPAVAFWLADGIAWLLYQFVPSRRRVAFDNVTAAFPELARDPGRADALVRAMYRHFVRAAVEGLILSRKLHVTNWRSFADLYPAKGLPAAMFADRAALLVTGHFGNWELAGYTMGAMGFKTYAIARVLDNPYLERFVSRLRQSTGQTIIAKKDDFDRLTAVMRNRGKVATLADQDAGSRGVFVEFFGRPASTHKAVALMAIEFDAVLVVIGVPRVDRAEHPAAPPVPGLESVFYAVEVEDVIDPREYAARPDAVRAITQRYTAALERLIRRHPEQYFWLHRRWKHQPAARRTRSPRAAEAAGADEARHAGPTGSDGVATEPRAA